MFVVFVVFVVLSLRKELSLNSRLDRGTIKTAVPEYLSSMAMDDTPSQLEAGRAAH